MAGLGAFGPLWTWVPPLVAFFCLAQAVRDFRRRAYVWGVLALLCAGALLLTPIQTHAVTLDLGPAVRR